MISIQTIIDNLIARLKDDAALSAFCAAKFGKALTVKQTFKNREEIDVKELPIILITRPIVKNNTTQKTETLRLYCGFYMDDQKSAQPALIEFEEAIDAALRAENEANTSALWIGSGDSINDEGMNHPEYFMVKEVTVQLPV